VPAGLAPADAALARLAAVSWTTLATTAARPPARVAVCGLGIVGNLAAQILDACRLVRKGGEVVLVGVPWRKRTELPAFDLLHAVFHRYVHLRSGWEWEVPRQPSDFRHGSIRENLEGALAWLASGRLRTTGLYRVADPREPQPVYEALRDQRGELTAVFDWDRA
jgi:threonine dehydrogenase-like Zn-dependent dehydrogenase